MIKSNLLVQGLQVALHLKMPSGKIYAPLNFENRFRLKLVSLFLRANQP